MLEKRTRPEELENREDQLCFEFTEGEERLMRRAGELVSKGELGVAESGSIIFGGKCFGERSFMEFLSDEEKDTSGRLLG